MTPRSLRVVLLNYEMDETSPVLAWQALTARSIAGLVEHVTVFTAKAGSYTALQNMTVHTIPRRPMGIPRRWGGAYLAWLGVRRTLRDEEFDVVFAHMSFEWMYRLYLGVKRRKVPIVLWYAHGTVTRRLRFALMLVDRVVTSSPEGFRILSPKVRSIGQGVDADTFGLRTDRRVRSEVAYVGRVSARKHVELVIEAVALARSERPDLPLSLRIVGPAVTAADREYLHMLKELVLSLGLTGAVIFREGLPSADLPPELADTFVEVNLSETGSMDKTSLEALAMGIPVLTSNVSFAALLAPFPKMYIRDATPRAVAHRLVEFHDRQLEYSAESLRVLIVGRHDQASYGLRVVQQLSTAVDERRDCA